MSLFNIFFLKLHLRLHHLFIVAKLDECFLLMRDGFLKNADMRIVIFGRQDFSRQFSPVLLYQGDKFGHGVLDNPAVLLKV
jgi:hypothetical protein